MVGFVFSVGFYDLLDSLLADGALFVDNLAALLAEATMSTWHHHRVDLARHAHLATLILNVVLLVQQLRPLAGHHLRWVHHALLLLVSASVDRWE